MFPILNSRKEVIGFGARSLDGRRTPKYLNSPETILFIKHQTLYGIEQLKPEQPCLIVEGYLDVLACWGHTPAVSCLGTALSVEHLQHLWKVTSQTILCFDGDSAGQRATYKAMCTALPILEHGKFLRITSLPPGQDPQSIIQYQGWPTMSSIMTQALTLFESLYRRIFPKEVLSIPEKRAQAVRSWRKHVELIHESDIRYAYQALFKEKFYTKYKHRDADASSPPHVSSVLGVELLLGAVYQFPQLALEVEESLSQLHCPEAYRTIHQEIMDWITACSHATSEKETAAFLLKRAESTQLLERIRPHLAGWEKLDVQTLQEQWIEMFNIYQTQYYLEGMRDTLKKNAHVMFSQWEELKLLTC
jgi:DNA primase